MKINYVADSTLAVIVDHSKETFKVYEDCDIPTQDYVQIDLEIRVASALELKSLIKVLKATMTEVK